MSDADQPVFRVISGGASADEIAAVVAAVTVAARPAARPARRARGAGGWADRSAMLRRPLRPGPDGWRASGKPG
jgi:Acyl-CoA carboxylase epsilon subunit